MSITPGHFTLTPEQRRFKETLSKYPRLEPFWDFDKRECDLENLRKSLGALSHGEAIMARFLSGIWCGENVLEFDLIEAAKALDEEHRQCLIEWLSEPDFP